MDRLCCVEKMRGEREKLISFDIPILIFQEIFERIEKIPIANGNGTLQNKMTITVT